MALAKSTVIVLLMMMTLWCVSMAAEYKVGDSAGWTINIDYEKWAADKKFNVGDTIVFVYNSTYHNVERVTHEDYSSCNATSAIVVYSSGSDKIAINKPGHYYYLCGFPGHCQAGQKVNFRVAPSSSPTTTATQLPTSSSPIASQNSSN